MYKILNLEFETTSQGWREGQFSIPSDLAVLFGVKIDESISLEITSSKGTKYFITTIKSGFEVYPLKDFVGKNELIRVRISHAPTPM